MNTFDRTELLLGPDALARLRQASVAVFGLGAVGSFAVEALARAGVGSLRLVDCDVVRESNLNRQLLALASTLGLAKTELAARRVLDINPRCHVDPRQAFVDRETAPGLLTPAPDVVIDALDSLGPKVQLLAAAQAMQGPAIVSSMGAAWRTDPFAVRVGDLAETRQCPLARYVRKRLRAGGITDGIRCVYSVEPMPPAARRAIEAADGPDPAARGRPRRPLGSLACLTGLFGLIAAREAIACIVERAR